MMEALRSASLLTAIKTPYLTDGSIDLETYDFLLAEQVRHGVDGVIVGGTTGEGHLMHWEEHLMLIAHTVHRFGDRLKVVGNTGSNNTREALKATEYGFASGMHAALQINPYYGKTSEAGLSEHFQRLLQLGPAFIYNVPSRTGQDLPPELMQRLAESPNFIGVKECSGNERIAQYERQGIACWSGNDDQCFAGRHAHRSHGVISVTSNILPGCMRKLMDTNDAAHNEALQPLISWIFQQPNPIGINTLLAMTGATQPVFRLPYVPLEREARQQGLELLRAFTSEQRVGSRLEVLNDSDFHLAAQA
jgi:4-hydroxy-tetrahydrodipicolinate synthase